MSNMVNIYTEEGKKIDITKLQKETRDEVVSMYKTLRKEKKITQIQLSKATGISQPNITRFEGGSYNPSLELMVRIAAAMGKKLEIKLVDEDISK